MLLHSEQVTPGNSLAPVLDDEYRQRVLRLLVMSAGSRYGERRLGMGDSLLKTLEEVRESRKGTLAETLGIEILSASPDEVVGRMPVDARTKQPAGLLHGGASVALAETLASIGGCLRVWNEGKAAVGLEINANHLRAVRSGHVTGTARCLHAGSQTQVWEIRIVDERQRLTCVGRCSLFNVKRDDTSAT